MTCASQACQCSDFFTGLIPTPLEVSKKTDVDDVKAHVKAINDLLKRRFLYTCVGLYFRGAFESLSFSFCI